MPFALIFGAIGAVASIAGAFIQAKGAADASAASVRAEKLRETQMNLESARQRKQIYRNVLRARASAIVGATAQGAGQGSGIAGGLGQIAGQGADNILGVNQAQSISSGIFKENMNIANAQSLASFGGGLSSLGQTISGLRVG